MNLHKFEGWRLEAMTGAPCQDFCSVVVNDKLHEPQDPAAEDVPEVDVEGILKESKRREKKKSREGGDHDSDPVTTTTPSLPLPSPKSRKSVRSEHNITPENV